MSQGETCAEGMVDDPIDLPKSCIHGVRYPNFEALTQENFDKFCREVKFKDNDIVLISYPKTGNHWVYGYLGMLKTRSEELITVKGGLLEVFCDAKRVETCPEPRIFSTHILYDHLPREILENRKIKIFIVIRNPKDTAVSSYHFIPKLYKNYTGPFDKFIKRWVNGEMSYGSWFDYYRPYYESLVGRENVHVIQFEKMKSNFHSNFKKIADFLEINVTDEYLKLIEEKTTISRMTEWASTTESPKDMKPPSIFYRKGAVGDWKTLMDEDMAKTIDDKFEKMRPILQGWEDFDASE